jgi:hypothetical protein
MPGLADVSIDEVCFDGEAAVQLTPSRKALGVRARKVLVLGLDSAARAELLASLRAERDTLAYLPHGCGLGVSFSRALVAALWRAFPGCPALRAAYFASWHANDGEEGGGAGPSLFRALFRAFRVLVCCHTLEPGTTSAGGTVAADTFAELLGACAHPAAVLARQLLLARRLPPEALAAWARTPAPGGHDFAKLLHCAESALRALRADKPWALPLLLDPPAAPSTDLFGPESRAWYVAQRAAAASASPTPTPAPTDVDAWLDAVGQHAVLRMAEAHARAGNLPGLEALLMRLPRATRWGRSGDAAACPELAASLGDAAATYAALPLLLPNPSADAAAVMALLTGPVGGLRAAAVCESMVRAGLAQGRLRALFHALNALLFLEDGVTPRPLVAELFAADPPFPAAVAAAVREYKAVRGSGDDDLLCGVADVALRLQFSPAVLAATAAQRAQAAAGPRPGLGGVSDKLRRRTPLPPAQPGNGVVELISRTLNFRAFMVALHDTNLALFAPGAVAVAEAEADADADADAAPEASTADEMGAAADGDASPEASTAEEAVDAAPPPLPLPPLLPPPPPLNWHARRSGPLLATFEAFFNLCLRHRPGHMQALLREMHGWQETLFRTGAGFSLRARFVDLIRTVPPYSDVYAGIEPGDGGGFLGDMQTGELLTHYSHFSSAALTAMILPTRVLRGADLTMNRRRTSTKEEEDEGDWGAGTGLIAAPEESLPVQAAGEGEDTDTPPAQSLMTRLARRSSSAAAELASANVDVDAPDPEVGEPPESPETPPRTAVTTTLRLAARARLAAMMPRAAKLPAWLRRRSDVDEESSAAPPDDVSAPPEDVSSPPDDDAPPPAEAPPPPDTALLDVRDFVTDARVVYELVELGLYLKKLAGLDQEVLDLLTNMNDAKNGAEGAKLHKKSVMLILEDVRARRAAGTTAAFFDLSRAARPALLTLTTINECACSARDALAMLAAQPVSQTKLRSVFSYYVERAVPAAWTGLFKGTATIAFFLLYLDREDYDQAFEAFVNDNAGAGNPGDAALFMLLIEPVKRTYAAPLFKLEASTLSDEEKVKELIDGIRAEGTRESQTVLGMLKLVTAGWMELSAQKFQVPMSPRNAQIISMLLCCEWVRRRLEGDPIVPKEQRSFITRVGTGEGKSLIIAMIAIYVVQILKKKVCVRSCAALMRV